MRLTFELEIHYIYQHARGNTKVCALQQTFNGQCTNNLWCDSHNELGFYVSSLHLKANHLALVTKELSKNHLPDKHGDAVYWAYVYLASESADMLFSFWVTSQPYWVRGAAGETQVILITLVKTSGKEKFLKYHTSLADGDPANM